MAALLTFLSNSPILLSPIAFLAVAAHDPAGESSGMERHCLSDAHRPKSAGRLGPAWRTASTGSA
jgi:hypothetical protein